MRTFTITAPLRKVWGFAVCLLVWGAACGSAPPKQTRTRSLEDLQVHVVGQPRDDEARVELARALEARSRPAAALGHYLLLERRGALSQAERQHLAQLLVKRARLRLEREDPDASTDLDRATRIGGQAIVPRELVVPVLELRLAHELRGGTKLSAAGPLLRRLRAAAGGGLWGTVPVSKERDPLARVGRFGAWLWRAGVKREGWSWLRAYAERGGKSEVLRVYADATEWWQGAPRTVDERVTPVAAPPDYGWLGGQAAKAALLGAWQMLAGAPGQSPWPKTVPASVGHGSGLPPWAARALALTRSLPAADYDPIHVIMRAYVRDPASSERLARVWVERHLLQTEAMLFMAELYRRLGDPVRFRRWVESAAEEGPLDAEVAYLRGVAAMVANAQSEAEIHWTLAASLSGDAGQVFERAAADALEMGEPLLSLAAARRAVSLIPPLRRDKIYRIAATASRELGRTKQAREIEALFTDGETGAGTAELGVIADVAQLEAAARLDPMAAQPRARLLERASGQVAERAFGESIWIVLVGPDREARTAAAAAVSYLESRGDQRRARSLLLLARGI